MKNNVIAIVALYLGSISIALAQAPASWTINPNAFNNSMTITCELNHLCDNLRNTNNVIAAFVGDECRGVAFSNVQVGGKWLAYLTVYSNTVGETITFKGYDADEDKVYKVLNAVVFNTNGVGGINDPILFIDNNPPTDIALSTYQFLEDVEEGDQIAIITGTDADVDDVLTFSLPEGEFDNDKYTISGDTLVAKGPYESDLEPEHTVRIVVTDLTGCSYTEDIKITVVGVHKEYPPTDINVVLEKMYDRDKPGKFVGVLSTIDIDQAAGHSYTFSTCEVEHHNDLLVIRGDSIFLRATIYYDITPIIKTCIRTTDLDGLYFEKSFSIVLEEPHDPTDIFIDNLTIKEGNMPDFKVGILTTADEDLVDSFTYELVSGDGDDDNNQFYIVDDVLYVTLTTNYDVRNEYHFRMRSYDVRRSFIDKSFTLTIQDDPLLNPPLPVVNYISPNGDGKNDYWAIQNVEIYRDFSLRIFDQFGNTIYSKDNNYQNDWDGTLKGSALPDGNYFYIFKSGKKVYKGNIAIVNQ
jgi:gliding motility-associated-like protein